MSDHPTPDYLQKKKLATPRPMDVFGGEQGPPPTTIEVETKKPRWRLSDRAKFWIGLLIGLGVLVMVIVWPISYSYIKYYQYAFQRNSVENNINDNKVYTAGDKLWDPQSEAIIFPKDYQTLEYTGPQAIVVFANDGLEFTFNAYVYYRLNKTTLPETFRSFSTNYNHQYETVVRTSLKNIAPLYSVDDYITNRRNITQDLNQAVSEEVASIGAMVPSNQHKFVMGQISLPARVVGKNLDTAIQLQQNIEEKNKQAASLTRKETERLMAEVNANITVILHNAEATSERIRENAHSEALKIVEIAEGEGIHYAMETLGIVDPVLQKKFLELTAMMDGNNPRVLLGAFNAILNIS